VDNRNFGARYLLGIARFQQGAPEEALEWIQSALEIEPASAEALSHRGNVLHALGRLHEALESYDRALKLDPDNVGIFYNRAITLTQLRRLKEAIESYDEVLTRSPLDADAWFNRGVMLSDLGDTRNALASYDKAIAIRPDYAEALYNSGIALAALQRFPEACDRYNLALAAKPDFAEAFYNRGVLLHALNQLEEALADFDRAVAIKPGFCQALNNRAAVLFDLKRPQQALEGYRQVLSLDPDDPYALGGMASAALNICDWAETSRLSPLLTDAVFRDNVIIPPFTLLGYSDDPAILSRAAANLVRKIAPQQSPTVSAASSVPGKIRIAYLSGDFRDHAVAALAVELFERHDRSRFEVLGISYGHDDGSEMRQRLRKAFDSFADIRNKSDAASAALLKEAGVDIVVDLNGHTQGSRQGILSHRPCPVQVTYLGYPGPSGADYVDYVIADPIVLPSDQQPFYKEQIVHLPHCYQVNDSKRSIAAQAGARRDHGLPEHGFVFCCFNNNWKITPSLFAVWTGLLADVPNSVLWLMTDNDGASSNLRRHVEGAGIDPHRLIFAPRLPMPSHLARHRLADLFLDTLPYNAHTTASDALWAGLPLITCKGKSFAGRVAASLLKAIGMPEMVTEDLASYRALAFRLATDRHKLNAIRAKLGQNRSTTPLFDGEGFRCAIEAAYLQMWKIAQAGEQPRYFRIEPNQPSLGGAQPMSCLDQ
jgi:protein O-GlcNAc transferase